MTYPMFKHFFMSYTPRENIQEEKILFEGFGNREILTISTTNVYNRDDNMDNWDVTVKDVNGNSVKCIARLLEMYVGYSIFYSIKYLKWCQKMYLYSNKVIELDPETELYLTETETTWKRDKWEQTWEAVEYNGKQIKGVIRCPENYETIVAKGMTIHGSCGLTHKT